MDVCTNEFYKKKIVITGASSGIGSCCANYFLNCGAQVGLVGRDVEGLKLIAKQYQKNATIVASLKEQTAHGAVGDNLLNQHNRSHV